MGKDVIIACDFPSGNDALHFLDQFTGQRPFVKIGMELFYAEGPDIVREIKKRGHRVFLDLKLHDIPNTVEKSMERLADLGVDMTNVHASGGIQMMNAGLRGLQKKTSSSQNPPLLIAVTQLTSTSQEMMENELLIREKLPDVVIQYAQNAKTAGLGGVVCSALEAGMIHDACGSSFITITPGIRFSDGSKDDQKRVTTPAQAKELGADYIVVGRSITKADDPVSAYQRCLNEFLG